MHIHYRRRRSRRRIDDKEPKNSNYVAGGLSDIEGLLSQKIWGPTPVSFEPPQLHTQSSMIFNVFLKAFALRSLKNSYSV
jgi:hypothetical protein